MIRPTAFAGGYQNEFPVVTHGWSEKVRGRQGERTTTPQTIERSTKNQAPDILEYLMTKFLRSISGIRAEHVLLFSDKILVIRANTCVSMIRCTNKNTKYFAGACNITPAFESDSVIQMWAMAWAPHK